MAEADAPRRSWIRRLLHEILALVLVLAALAVGGLILLDTAPGHRFIVDRIAALEPSSGLRIKIGRIDGSIFGKAKLHGVTLSDPHGVFLTSPEVKLDWAPAAWLYNSLHIDDVESPLVKLERLPKLRPSKKKGPLLPSFDIHIGKLKIDRLELGPGVAGTARSGRVNGEVEIRAGRAMIGLNLAVVDGDRLSARIDAEPERNRLDIDVHGTSPADGLIPAMIGLRQPIVLDIAGAGNWTKWRGTLRLKVGGRESGALDLAADSGRYRVKGTLAPAPFLTGKMQRLTAPAVRINGSATFDKEVLDGELALTSPSLRAVARGAVDLGEGRYRNVRLGADLARPPALFTNMHGRDVRLLATLDGKMGDADYSYRLTSTEIGFDNVGFVGARAEGRGQTSRWPMRLPLLLRAREVTGLGDVAGGILRNISLQGMLEISPQQVRGEKLALRSDKVMGTMALIIDLKTGKFTVDLSGSLNRYLVPGIGLVDVTTKLNVVPGPDGHGSHITGTAEANVRRLDNSFFASLTGGLPRITSNLDRGTDGILRLTNLQLYSPKLRLSGQGMRRKDGTFLIEAQGRQAQYGPVRLKLDGHIERPKVDLLFDRPNDAMGLHTVKLSLQPTVEGFDYRAAGGSRLGPFTSSGAILLPKGAPTVIRIAELHVAGSNARGDLRADPGGFSGTLAVAGGGLDGTLAFAPVSGDQRIDVHLLAKGFHAEGPPPLSVRNGRIDGSILLAEGRTTLEGSFGGRGVVAGGITLLRLDATAKLVDGAGQVKASLAGTRGADFAFDLTADVSPERISVSGKGSLDERPLVLATPAVITATADGWEIAPTKVRFGGGIGTLSGRTGAQPELRADIQAMPMQLLDIVLPNARLGGVASGHLEYRWKGQPSGNANLRIRGLSRAGLVLTSKPIDVGVNAVLDGNKAAARAVAVSDGKTIGRAQARFTPIGKGPIVAELMNAPMFLQMRYAGPADTLWRLSGIEIFDLSGPVSIAADIDGRLVDPRIRGSVRAKGARIESAVTGTVVEKIVANGRFEGSRLVLSGISGSTPGNGNVTGGGTIDFAGGNPALDLKFSATKAALLARDDIAATVTGPLAIKSNGVGGRISGQFHLVSGRFTLGQASAAASVPKLQVREVGQDTTDVIELAQLEPWRLDIDVEGGPLTVRGLGIESRWSTKLKVGGTADSPSFDGRADLIRGDYEFAGRNFRLSRGIIRFRGQSPPNPLLDIAAEAQVQGLDASVKVGGTGLNPEIQFTSVPQLPQDELLSRLLFGTSITNLSAPEAVQLASAVAALQSGSGGLDPINAVRRAVGLDRLRVLPADISTGQKTAIAAGKYIGRKLFVEVITDGQGYSATRVEYQVTRWLSVLSSISTIGRTSANVRISKDY